MEKAYPVSQSRRKVYLPDNDARSIGPKDHLAYMVYYIDGFGLDRGFDFMASGEKESIILS
ncbi:MAG: hypothetical protein CL912_07325 [Deltaproteobacteria bacterium]|nr:hypothetical protein [Deltaproteobacteria bacterium]